MIDTSTRVSLWGSATPMLRARRCIIYPGVSLGYETMYHGKRSERSNRSVQAFKRAVTYISRSHTPYTAQTLARKVGAALPHKDTRGVTAK